MKKILTSFLSLLFILTTCVGKKTNFNIYNIGNNKMYHKGWIDFNKNGKMDVYENPKAHIKDRIEDLLSQMTLEEKTCQLVTLYGYGRVLKDSLPTPKWKNKIWKDGIGAIDEQLNGFERWSFKGKACTLDWPASRHAKAINDIQRFFIEETRLGIPADMTNEGIRGVEAYQATDFPHPIGLGCTWDRELLYQAGYIAGREGHLLGFTNVYGPVLDVMRDQRWGRCEESYGESPFLVGEMGVQYCRGLQTNFQVAATAKHFLAYSNNKGARESYARTDPQMGLREVFNLHLYPYYEVVRRAGLLGVMCSYNDIDGQPVEGCGYWLMQILRNILGFHGYVVSDSDAVEYLYTKHHTAKDRDEAVRQSIMAGLNVRCTFEEPETYIEPLRRLLDQHRLNTDTLNNRVRDVLRVKFIVGLFDHPYQTNLAQADIEVNSSENNKTALRASRECMVLLKNEDHILPFNFSKIKKVAVIGPNANATEFAVAHYGPQAVKVTSIYDGMKNNLKGKCEVVYEKGCDIVDKNWPESEVLHESLDQEEKTGIQKAVNLAKCSDVVVLVLGGGPRTCGESKSRTSIDLPGRQEDLMEAVCETGKPVVLVLINGRPLSINWAKKHVKGILESWYPGAHGGQAVFDILSGAYNPSGKLNVTIPKTVGEIPFNYPTKPAANSDGGTKPGMDGNQTRVNGALWYFGEGMSYTSFKYSDLTVTPKDVASTDSVDVTFKITNTGDCEGDEITQLYIRDVVSSVTTYEKRLAGFQRVHLKQGETKSISMKIRPESLSLSNAKMERVIEPGDFEVMVGASSVNLPLKGKFTITGVGIQVK